MGMKSCICLGKRPAGRPCAIVAVGLKQKMRYGQLASVPTVRSAGRGLARITYFLFTCGAPERIFPSRKWTEILFLSTQGTTELIDLSAGTRRHLIFLPGLRYLQALGQAQKGGAGRDAGDGFTGKLSPELNVCPRASGRDC